MAIFILPGKSPFALTLATSRVIVHPPPPMPTILFTVVHPAHVGELLRWGWQERRWRVLSSAPRLWHFTEKEQMVTCSAKPHNKLLSPARDLYSGRGQAHSSSLFICCKESVVNTKKALIVIKFLEATGTFHTGPLLA